jgi:hypothetical protein
MRALLPLAAVALLAACDDETRPAGLPTAPTGVSANALSAFITISKPHAGVGDEITVVVRAKRGTNVGEIGSFQLRLSYDASRLELIETKRSDFGMVMANTAEAGFIVAAGASGQGFDDDRLLTATFRVTGARPTRGLALDVAELNSIAFQDQRSVMRVEKDVFLGEQK